MVTWRSTVGADGSISGVMTPAPAQAQVSSEPKRAAQPEPTPSVEPEATEESEQQPQRVQRSTLLDGIERKQTMIDGGSTAQVAAVVGGQAINRYGQILARVDQPEEVA